MLYNTHDGQTWVFRTAMSPDGIHWQAGDDFATDRFLEMSSFYKHNGLYVANGQGLTRGEGGSDQGRQGYARVSTDFDHWLVRKPRPLRFQNRPTPPIAEPPNRTPTKYIWVSAARVWEMWSLGSTVNGTTSLVIRRATYLGPGSGTARPRAILG